MWRTSGNRHYQSHGACRDDGYRPTNQKVSHFAASTACRIHNEARTAKQSQRRCRGRAKAGEHEICWLRWWSTPHRRLAHMQWAYKDSKRMHIQSELMCFGETKKQTMYMLLSYLLYPTEKATFKTVGVMKTIAHAAKQPSVYQHSARHHTSWSAHTTMCCAIRQCCAHTNWSKLVSEFLKKIRIRIQEFICALRVIRVEFKTPQTFDERFFDAILTRTRAWNTQHLLTSHHIRCRENDELSFTPERLPKINAYAT